MQIYDGILEGHSYTKETAVDWARGVVWSEMETSTIERIYPHSDYIDTVEGVEVYYCYGADHFYFVESVDTVN